METGSQARTIRRAIDSKGVNTEEEGTITSALADPPPPPPQSAPTVPTDSTQGQGAARSGAAAPRGQPFVPTATTQPAEPPVIASAQLHCMASLHLPPPTSSPQRPHCTPPPGSLSGRRLMRSQPYSCTMQTQQPLLITEHNQSLTIARRKRCRFHPRTTVHHRTSLKTRTIVPLVKTNPMAQQVNQHLRRPCMMC